MRDFVKGSIVLKSALAMAAALFVSAPTRAEQWKAIPAEMRTPAAPMPLVVHLAQGELHIGNDPGFEAVAAPQGGLVGALIAGALQSSQTKKARARVEPILNALGEYDADAPLMAGIKRGLTGLNWVSLSSAAPLRDNSFAAKSALLDQTPGNHLADADCTYRIGVMFQTLYVRCQVQVAAKNGPSGALGEVRWKTAKLMLDRAVETEVELDLSAASPARVGCYRKQDREWCKALWEANSAALLRAEMTSALEKAGELVGREMSLTAEDMDAGKAAKDRRVKFFMHEGTPVEGADNVIQPGSSNFFVVRAAVVKSDSDGVLLLEDRGNLYHKRAKAVR